MKGFSRKLLDKKNKEIETQSNVEKETREDESISRLKSRKNTGLMLSPSKPIRLRKISKNTVRESDDIISRLDSRTEKKTTPENMFSVEAIKQEMTKTKSKFAILEDLDKNKMSNEELFMNLLNTDDVMTSLDNFVFRGTKNAVFNINNFDTQFYRTNYANKNSNSEFYKKFRIHRELMRKNVIKKETPSFAFIREIKEIHMPPHPLGLIKKKGDDSEIELSDYYTGNKYVNIIAKSIVCSEINHVKKLDLSSNRINSVGLSSFLTNLQVNRRTISNLRKLDLSNNLIGHEGALTLCELISHDECHLKDIILENTNLTNKSIDLLSQEIKNNIDSYIQCLNFGRNNLTENSINSICDLIKHCYALRVLQLHGNKINNKGGALLISTISTNREIKFLDISNNEIGNNITNEVTREEIYKTNDPLRSTFRNYDLKEFSKTMNIKFKDIVLPSIEENGKGAKNKIPKPDYLKSIKLQKNMKIPEIPISPFAIALGQLFKSKEVGLVHLNISHNKINYIDCSHIEEEVKNNHTILGIHVEGNEMSIDSLGFIHAFKKNERKNDYFANSQISYETKYNKESNILMGNSLLKSKITKHLEIKHKNNCWICEGWNEMQFILDHDNKTVGYDKKKCTNAKIYLNIDNYKAFEMNYVKSDENSVVYRMCPPGEVKYFYTLDDKLIESNSNNIEYLSEPIKIVLDTKEIKEEDEEEIENKNNKQSTNNIFRNSNQLNFHNLTYSTLNGNTNESLGGGFMHNNNIMKNRSIKNMFNDSMSQNSFTKTSYSEENFINVTTVNKENVEDNNKIIDHLWINHLHFCLPRPKKDMEKIERAKTPWTFRISIWARMYYYEYNGEPEEIISRAFEFDFNKCGFQKDIKSDSNELSDFKDYFRVLYNKM